MLNIEKFNFKEAFNNSKGKTSISLICGAYMIFIGGIGFAYAVFSKYGEGMAASTGLCALGGGLLGVRRFTKDKEVVQMDNSHEPTKTDG